MKSMTWKLAASSLVLGVPTVGCQMDGPGARIASASASSPRVERAALAQAVRFHREAGEAIAANNADAARIAMEQAVALSPRDAGYRLMLADIYLRSGRFQSAETTFRDVLAIDPSQTRAALTLALMTAANGRSHEALNQLEALEGRVAPADLGLAFALAGAPNRAIDILEPVARAQGATGRVRQNLALAHALAGDWAQARTIAAQDVAPSELSERMSQWASLAQSNQPAVQVAAVMGVQPVQDPGQPVQLALNASPDVAFAEAEPAPRDLPIPAAPAVDVAQADVPAADVAFAEAQVVEPVPVPAPAPVPAAPVAYAELETPDWGLDGTGAVQLPEPDGEREVESEPVRYAAATRPFSISPPPVAPRPAVHRGVMAERFAEAAPAEVAEGRRVGSGAFVVQIGAFSNAANAERAWQEAEQRFGLSERQPVTMTFDMGGRLLHRVAVSGFESRADATRLCASIQARGGACFVRSNAGDAVIRWAARYARNA